MSKKINGTLQIRRDTSTNWASKNPILLEGELGFDTTNKILKIGNGTTTWNSLASQIPTVNNGTLTIQKNGTSVGTFTANSSSNVTTNIIVPTKLSELNNDSRYIKYYNDYLNTHPENTPTIIPFIYNDLAFLTLKGGACSIYSTTDTDYTVASLTNSSLTISGMTNMFDGSPSYGMLSTTGSYTAVIDMVLHKVFTYSNKFYIDFGAAGWRAKTIYVYVMNSTTETKYTLKASITNNADGNWYSSVSHSSTNSSGTTVQGFNRLRIVLSNWNNTSSTSGKRIAQIGLINYGSAGVTETFISRGGCSGIYGNLIPYTNASYNLGSSSKKWSNIYANTFTGSLSGNATSASKLGSSTIGSATQPIYLNAGTATACSYTLGKSVPSDAKFTDTTYSAATSSVLGLVKTGSNITNTDGTISLTKSNITTALGYTPPTINTTNTAGSTDTSSKIFLVGATAQASSAQTYSHDTAYVGTDGCLYSGGTKVLTAHQSLSNYSTLANTIKALSISGKTITYTKGDGTTGTLTTQDTNTTYGIASASTAGIVKSSTTGTTANRDYNVQVNTDGTMKVNVPWTDTNTNTTYNIATASTAGLVKPISVITKPTINSATTNSGRYYPIQMSSDGNMFVNIPWSNTTYTTAGSASPGLIKVSSVNTTAVTVNSESTTAGRYYPVELNSDGKAIVNVPWTNNNTTYSAGNGLTLSGTTFTPSLVNTTVASNASSYTAGGSSKFYAVQLDSNKKLGVYVPWTDNNTTYSAATSSTLGLVKIGSNITNSSGTISLTKSNVTSALGYTPMNSSVVNFEMNNSGSLKSYGGFIDFHFHNSDGKPTNASGTVVDTTPDYTSRIIENAAGQIDINNVKMKSGTLTATSVVENGTALSSKYLGISSKASDSSKLNGQEASYYLNYNNFTNKPTIPSVDSALSTTSTNPVQNKIVTANINNLTTSINSVSSTAGTNSTAISTLNTKVSNLQTTQSSLATAISNMQTEIDSNYDELIERIPETGTIDVAASSTVDLSVDTSRTYTKIGLYLINDEYVGSSSANLQLKITGNAGVKSFLISTGVKVGLEITLIGGYGYYRQPSGNTVSLGYIGNITNISKLTFNYYDSSSSNKITLAYRFEL